MERPAAFVHEALLYADSEEFLAGTVEFVDAGLASGEAALVAVPEPRLSQIRERLGTRAAGVRFVDMVDAGRNPGQIIPGVLQAFVAESTTIRSRVVGEPIWPGRSAAEYGPAVQHEALINLAFAGRGVTIRCPYDLTRLPAKALVDAERTHPVLFFGSRRRGRPSPAYTSPVVVAAAANRDLPPPPASAGELDFGLGELKVVRRFVREHARRAGLSHGRIDDLTIAVNEIAGNALAHAGGFGMLRMWLADDSLVCEIRDGGQLIDLLAGRTVPAADAVGGRGLLIANQLCDLVQLHPTPTGTTIRLHLRLRR